MGKRAAGLFRQEEICLTILPFHRQTRVASHKTAIYSLHWQLRGPTMILLAEVSVFRSITNRVRCKPEPSDERKRQWRIGTIVSSGLVRIMKSSSLQS
jgi:hypothetical protein